jgi:hypothetical protein
LLQHFEICFVAVFKLLRNILQNRSRPHHAVPFVDLAGEMSESRKPAAGEHAALLGTTSSGLCHRANDCPRKDIVPKISEVPGTFYKDFCNAVIHFDLCQSSGDDDMRIGERNFGKSSSHWPYIRVGNTLQDVFCLRPRLIESRFDIGVPRRSSRKPFQIHQVPYTNWEVADQFKNLIDHSSIGLR